ncbi:molybdenum ABC transporter permease [Chitinophaga caeni]|uniref:Molybdenum ABC transporter permease n=1 Tax=Chitinophaga caeni TaxID=2029983 RepID=A0A291QYC3_9BACT|nr:molybdenum ABC transporter permease [Chitinophaga caeni]ATL48940.1 molybdenum ABC transporter permease [Chitinophaga caeni]
MDASLILGIIALAIGLPLRYWINRRKFYRRSPFGSEGFSSYEQSWMTRFVERVGKWLAYALILFGILGVLAHYSLKKKKEKAAQQAATEQHHAAAAITGNSPSRLS